MNPFGQRTAASFEFKEIVYEKDAPIPGAARVTLNRPQAYNAYTTPALRELAEAFRDAALDDRIGVVVFTGAGDRAFCTGGDVKEYASSYVMKPREYWKYMALFRAYLESILDCGKPVIARINGMAVGGGNESQLACDLSIAAEHAVLRQVGVRVGSVAAGGATQWLPLAVGDRRARWMLMTCDPVSARRAEDWGLVWKSVPSVRQGAQWIEGASPDQIRRAFEAKDGYRIDLARLDEEVAALAAKLLETFPECMRYTKRQANFFKDLAWHQTIGHAQEWLALHYTHWEPLEGMQAFAEKRPADYARLRAEAAGGGWSESLWGGPVGSCEACGARNLPARFTHCGVCGAALAEAGE